MYWDYRSGDRLDVPKPASHGDMAILLRRRKHLPEIEWALQRHGIPYHIHGGIGFYGRPEIKAMCNVLTFLAHNDNDIALYGALRSSYFGFSDATLYQIAQVTGFQLWQKLRNYAKTSEELQILKTVEILKNWLHYCKREPIPELLQRVIQDSGIFAVFGGIEQGDQYVANLEKLVAMARETTAASSVSLADFVEELLKLVEIEPIEEEAQLEEETSDSVMILTVHAAKGLEFPIVIVPDLSREFKQVTDTVLIDERGIGLKAPNPNDNFNLSPSFLLRFLRYELKQKFRAEEGRLLYVALTRAKDHLVLITRDYKKDPPEGLESGKSWRDWLWVSMGLSEELVESQLKKIEHNGKFVEIPVTREPYDRNRLHKGEPGERHDISKIDYTGALPEKVTPLLDPEEELIISPSEINEYLKNPEAFKRNFEGEYSKRINIKDQYEDKALRGTIIHEIFEGIDQELVKRKYESQIDSLFFDEAIKLYETFRAQPLMQNINEEYTEVPFRVRFDGWILSGIVDLLIRKDDQWILIDYKTGRPKPEEYRLQVTLYQLALERILQSSVNCFVYFTKQANFEEVKEDTKVILERASQAALEIGKIHQIVPKLHVQSLMGHIRTNNLIKGNGEIS